MKLAVATKARVGFAVALAGLLGAFEVGLCDHVALLRAHIPLISMLIGGMGLALLIFGRFFEDTSSDSDHPLAFLVSMRYWGMIWILSTVGLYSFNALRHPFVIEAKAKTEVAKPKSPVVATPPVVQTKAMVVFPHLELKALIVNGTRSSALINGQVLFIGETISNVALISVDEHVATVELDGRTNVLALKD